MATSPTGANHSTAGAETVQLIERGDSLQLLTAALATARGGTGRTVLISGEAGIGKTSIVTCLAAERGAMRLLWGGCEALHSPRPLGPLYDMAPDLAPSFRAMLGPQMSGVELFSALMSEIRAAPQPTLLVFEDMHWADDATLDLIKFLARRIERVPAVLALTYRNDELGESHPLRLLLGDLPSHAIVRVPLAPLTETGVAELARRARRAPEGLFAVTAGNPFFVTEALLSEGVPATVRDAVVARAMRQPPSVRALLDLVAIVPARLEIALAHGVLSPTADDVSAALASGLLAADGSAYHYRHELARLAIEGALNAPAASTLHARMLAHLEALAHGTDSRVALTRLVHHAARAGESAAVLRYAPQAASEAASHGAHREAAVLYATALAHSFSLSPIARADLLDRLAYQRYLTDQTEESIAARLSALEIWRAVGNREQEGRALRWLSRLHWILSHNDAAETYAAAAVTLLETLKPGRELAWALSNRSQLHVLAGRNDEAVAWGTRALALAREEGDAEIEIHASINLGTARYAAGCEGGQAELERSVAMARAANLSEHVTRAYSNLATVSLAFRDYDTASRVTEEAQSYCADRDLDSSSKFILAYRARLDLEQGRWDDVAAVVDGLLGRVTVSRVARIPALVVKAHLLMRRGEPGALELIDEATVLATRSGELLRLAPVAVARAEASWLMGDDMASDGLVAMVYARAEASADLRTAGELSFWMRRIGMAHRQPSRVEPAYALQFAGHWQAAADEWMRLGCQYESALALVDGNEEGIRSGLKLLDRLGAAAAARRCREHLQRSGVRGVPRGPRTATSTNPAGLTARELQILALLGRGLTNTEIAREVVRSRKTVDHHVAAILRKLDVHSRRDAARIAGRLGLLTR